MKYILSVCMIVLLSACSMAPKQTAQRSNSIRIIKEQPKRYEYERTYNTKIEQVDYNSSIIRPEIEGSNTKQIRKHKKYSDDNRFTKGVKNKVSSTVSSKTSQIESRASGAVNRTIDRGISSLFR